MDIACGTGALSKKISQLIGNIGILAGIDISRKALSIAKARILNSNVSFIEMDGENIFFL